MKNSLLLLVLVAFFGEFDNSFAQDKPTPFTEVVEANFKLWDLNGDGMLTKDEVLAAAANPKFRDEAAAAVAALEHGFRNKDFAFKSVTKAELLSSMENNAATAGEEKSDEKDSNSSKAGQAPPFQKFYRSSLKKIRETSRELFPQSLPSFDATHQGALGDCPFVSTVGAMVYRNPAAVKAMFTPKENGSTTVNFGNGQSLNIHNLTDVDIALWSSAGTNGLWLTILEKAYRRMLVATEHPDPKDRPSIYDKFGPSKLTLEILDGHQTRKFALREVKSGKIKLETLRNDLIDAQREHLLVKAETPSGRKNPSITPDHAYAILGYNKETDLVHVWNPHGNNFTPKGSDGLQNGYTTKRGEFDIPLKDLVQIYSDVNVETQIIYRH